ALGRQGRDFFRLLQTLDTTGSAWHELDFVDPLDEHDPSDEDTPSPPALAVLQSDILHLRQRPPSERSPLAAVDTSLEIHACHSPMREMEVLRDRLLDLFATPRPADATPWRPGDILVMVPDIDLYGPYVQAVFGVERADTPAIPFALADRRAGRERPPAETFLDVLGLLGARITVREVFDLLDTPAIRHRFGLATDDLPTLRRFADATRIRWALDGPHKARHFDVPADAAHTWRAGLDRWLLGYATGETDELVADIAPHAGDTAGFIEVLGRFALYMDTLAETLRRLEAPRSPTRWARDLATAIDGLFEAEDDVDERGLQWLRDAVHQLAEAEHRGGIDGPLSPRVAIGHLRRALDGEGFGGGFVDGRVTFCRLEPMRSVPFRLIAVCGLDDGAFPRRNREIGFDLMASDPRPGDRTPRDDDRYLFLETLLAARERLHLSYVGRSQKDSSEREPSVVLAELLDQVDRTFVGVDGRPPRDQLLIEHRLQPWSPSYFRAVEAAEDAGGIVDPRRLSHSVDDAAGACALVGPRHRVPLFADRPLVPPGPEEAADALDLDALIRFAILPCRSFLERLQLRLDDRDAEHDLPDAEPFDLDGLAAYDLRQAMTEARRRPGFDVDRERRQLTARGELPAARLGVATYQHLARRVDAFVEHGLEVALDQRAHP
ncbi:MAG: exodeoxyribonuclease V subunit gamma, partial [Acidobacteriota bacterium]